VSLYTMQPRSKDNKVLKNKKNVNSKRQNKGAGPVVLHPGYPLYSFDQSAAPAVGFSPVKGSDTIPVNLLNLQHRINGSIGSVNDVVSGEACRSGTDNAPIPSKMVVYGSDGPRLPVRTFRNYTGPNVQIRRLPKEGVIHVGRHNVKIPRGNGFLTPPSVYVGLRWFGEYPINLSTFLFQNYRFRPSGAYDLDPLVGGTTVPGFTNLSAFYSTYRVTCSKIRVEVVNPSTTTSVITIVCPKNSDPGGSETLANIVASEGNPYAKSKVTSLAGGPRTVITNFMTTEKIFGDAEVWTDHNFASLINTVPSNNWFWDVGFYTPAVIGVALNVWIHIEIGIEFFDRTFLPS